MHKTIIAAVLTSVLIPGYAVALEDIHTGTVIVGSGVSGLTTAILLKEHKQNVLVLEKCLSWEAPRTWLRNTLFPWERRIKLLTVKSSLCLTTSKEQRKPAEIPKCSRVQHKECSTRKIY